MIMLCLLLFIYGTYGQSRERALMSGISVYSQSDLERLVTNVIPTGIGMMDLRDFRMTYSSKSQMARIQ